MSKCYDIPSRIDIEDWYVKNVGKPVNIVQESLMQICIGLIEKWEHTKDAE